MPSYAQMIQENERIQRRLLEVDARLRQAQALLDEMRRKAGLLVSSITAGQRARILLVRELERTAREAQQLRARMEQDASHREFMARE